MRRRTLAYHATCPDEILAQARLALRSAGVDFTEAPADPKVHGSLMPIYLVEEGGINPKTVHPGIDGIISHVTRHCT